MGEVRIGFALTGSFCTFKAVFEQLGVLLEQGYHVIPIMSENAYSIDTRFGRAADWVEKAEAMCGEKVIHTIAQAEPIGPKKLLDLLIVAPCTGNTLGKLACGIYDTAPNAGRQEPPQKRKAGAHRRIHKRCAGRFGGQHRHADEPQRHVLCPL